MTRYLVLAAFCFLTVPGLGEQPASLYSKLPVWPGDDNLPPASKDKYVFWDPATAEIVMSYPKDPSDPSGARTTYRYRPQNQVEPQISVEISRETDGSYRYLYALRNGPSSRQSIDIFSIVGPGPDSEIRVEHPFWGKVRAKGSKAKQAALPPGTPDGEYINWASGGKAVPPGGTATDFVIVSNYRPGFTTAYAQGGRYLSFNAGGPPPEVARQLAPLMKLEVNNRTTLTLGPRFAPEAPRSLVAADYRLVMQQLLKTAAVSETDFFRIVIKLLDDCAASEAKPCLDDNQASFLSTQRAGIERDIASGLLLSFK